MVRPNQHSLRQQAGVDLRAVPRNTAEVLLGLHADRVGEDVARRLRHVPSLRQQNILSGLPVREDGQSRRAAGLSTRLTLRGMRGREMQRGVHESVRAH